MQSGVNIVQTATISVKFRIKPTDAQAAILLDTMHAYIAACNEVSKHIGATHCLAITQLSKDLYYHLREVYHLGAQMAQSIIRTVTARYKTICKTQKEWITPVFKKPCCELVWNRDYSFLGGVFSVNTLAGRIRVGYFSAGTEKLFIPGAKMGTALLQTKHGKWYLIVPLTLPVSETVLTGNVVGVDLGINFTAVSYDSAGKALFYSGRSCKQKRAKFKALRTQLQKRQTPSARRRLKAIGERENRWMRDMNHCVSKALVSSQPIGTLFVLEDLTGIRKSTERVRRKDRYMQVSWSFYDLRQKIEYKAKRYGSKVIAVSPSYTSQTCPVCGHRAKTNRNQRLHTFCCQKCGYQSNDDRVAAMNLFAKGKKYLSSADGQIA